MQVNYLKLIWGPQNVEYLRIEPIHKTSFSCEQLWRWFFFFFKPHDWFQLGGDEIWNDLVVICSILNYIDFMLLINI